MLKIIHICSSGKSGSTLLNILLGNCREVFAGAELFRYTRLWTRSEDMKCAGGMLVADSEFWSNVKRSVSMDDLGVSEDEICPDHIPLMIRAILNESQTEIVCDTSKSRKYQEIIYNKKAFKPFVIHLVRDGRAVVRSANKPILGSLKVGLIWCIANLQTRNRYGNRDNYLCLSYEELASNSQRVLGEIDGKLQQYYGISLNWRPYDRTENTYKYSFAGNRMRDSFNGSIRYDSRYIDGSYGVVRWALLTAIMLPALLIFKYPLSRTGCRDKFLDHAADK